MYNTIRMPTYGSFPIVIKFVRDSENGQKISRVTLCFEGCISLKIRVDFN
jgi:hypothetical protein